MNPANVSSAAVIPAVVRPGAVPRVVSLVPSATETLSEWGVTPIAVSRFCERDDLPHVGGTKNPDVAAISALQPDLVVLCDQENRLADHDALRAAGVPVFVFTITSLSHVAAEMNRLRSALNLAPDDLADALAHNSPPEPARVSAWVPIWRRPWMTINGDTYASTLLQAAGITNVCAHMDVRYPEIELKAVRSLAPDVVIAPTEPYHFTERHEAELSTVAPVLYVDGKDLFWWGVRTPTAIQRLRTQVGAR